MLFFAVATGLTLVVVLQVQVGLHGGPLAAALTLLPWSCGSALASLAAGTRLVPRFGPRLMPAGLVLLLVGLLGAAAAYATARHAAYPWPLLPALAVVGIGSGLFTVPFFTTALGRVRPRETGSAAGLLNAAQQLGGTLGVALLGTIFLGTAVTGRGAGVGPAALHGARDAFVAAAVLIVAALGTTRLMTGPRAGSDPGGDRSVRDGGGIAWIARALARHVPHDPPVDS